MRSIDADALIKFIENRYDITWEDDYEGGIKDACTDILEEINKMPTIEPQTGKWMESDTDGFVCSVCRNGYRCQPTLMGKPMFEYCPVCGAKMEETK